MEWGLGEHTHTQNGCIIWKTFTYIMNKRFLEGAVANPVWHPPTSLLQLHLCVLLLFATFDFLLLLIWRHSQRKRHHLYRLMFCRESVFGQDPKVPKDTKHIGLNFAGNVWKMVQKISRIFQPVLQTMSMSVFNSYPLIQSTEALISPLSGGKKSTLYLKQRTVTVWLGLVTKTT